MSAFPTNCGHGRLRSYFDPKRTSDADKTSCPFMKPIIGVECTSMSLRALRPCRSATLLADIGAEANSLRLIVAHTKPRPRPAAANSQPNNRATLPV
jgi:hypothetical protein